MLVCAMTIFQVFVVFLALFDAKRRVDIKYYRNIGQSYSANLWDVLYGGFEGGLVVSTFVSILLLLHFMKCHRDHVLQLYRGETTSFQDVSLSPAALAPIALSVPRVHCAGSCNQEKRPLSAEMLKYLEDKALGFLPTVGMAVFLVLFQLFLAHFAFRDMTYPNITVTIDNRRLFSIMSYFLFFYNILLGIFSCFLRILKGMVLGVIFISRIDRTSLMQGYQRWDKAFVAYLGFITVLVAHRHPVMLVFCQLLIDRNKDQQPLQERPPTKPVQRTHLRDPESSAAYRREPRLPRMSYKAVNRWFVAVTLLRNPSLVKYRCQGREIRPVVRLGSINIGTQI
ncbi:hypothetical protein OS493_025368 [Desmophyllum pertusum]|uniref:Uncharacterized protein n=1 Tax=Desmophyllum pertusum TaxID=174260 RepID=A0A9W9Z1C6_9CNID|nr:hypothetical protein OS493_025368 [Desmophyllum pertusum]